MNAPTADNAVLFDGSSHFIGIYDCDIHHAQQSCVVAHSDSHDCQISQSQIHHAQAAHGVALAGDDHRVESIIVYDSGGDGIEIAGERAHVVHATVSDNDGTGISLAAGALDAEIRNNIVAFNGVDGIASAATATGTVERNLVHGNAGEDYADGGGLTIISYDFGLETDPVFLDRPNRVYRIDRASPARNRAIPLLPYDYNNFARDISTPDIGAFEYGSTTGIPSPFVLVETVRPIWTFWLAESKNLENIVPLRLARGKQVSLTLNRAGSASFDLPLSSDIASLLQPFYRAIKVYRESPTAGVQLIWSGFINTLDEDITGNRITVSAVGWLERLAKRLLRRQKIYANQDDGDIIFDLLAEMNLTSAPSATPQSDQPMPDPYPIRVVPNSVPNTPTWLQQGQKLPNEGIDGPTPYLDLTTITPTAGRNKSYEAWVPVGPEITGLTEIENGCDIYVTPDSRALNIYRKRMRILPEVIFGYNWGPNNIAQLGRQHDGSTIVNWLVARHQLHPPRFQDDLDSQGLYGIIEEQVSLPEVANPGILQYYASAEVALRAFPRIVYTITPFPYAGNEGRVPEPFVDYDVGDIVYFSANWPPRVDIRNQGIRIFGISMTIDEEGNERPGPLQVSPGG